MQSHHLFPSENEKRVQKWIQRTKIDIALLFLEKYLPVKLVQESK